MTKVLRVVVDDDTYDRLNAAATERSGEPRGSAERERRVEELAENAISEAALGWWLDRGRPALPKIAEVSP